MISYVEAAKIVKEKNIETTEDCYKYMSANYPKHNIYSLEEARRFAGALELVVNSDSSSENIIKRSKLKNQKDRIGKPLEEAQQEE